MNIKVFYLFAKSKYLRKICFLSYGPKTSRPIRMQDSLNCNISKTSSGMKFDFCTWLNIKRSNKRSHFSYIKSVSYIKWVWSGMAKLWQIVSQIYLKNELSYEVCFLNLVNPLTVSNVILCLHRTCIFCT